MNSVPDPDRHPAPRPDPAPTVGTCSVVGLGLIGGSFALRMHDVGVQVHGWDPDPQTREAAAQAGIEIAESISDLPATDLALLAGPTSVVTEQLRTGDLPRAQVLIDACSAKGVVVDAAAAGSVDNLVPCHPMAGTEHSGFGAASADLLTESVWVMTPEEGQQIVRVRTVLDLLVHTFDARVVVTSAAGHDEAVAAISHVPHVSAQALVRGTERTSSPDLTTVLAAGSFRDATRVVRGDPAKTVELVTQNREQVIAQLSALVEDLTELRGWLREGRDAEVTTWFAHPAAPRGDQRSMPLATQSDLAAILAAGQGGYLVTAVGEQLTLVR